MVKTLEIQTPGDASDFDIHTWVRELNVDESHYSSLFKACEMVAKAIEVEAKPEYSWGDHTNCFQIGIEIAAMLSTLHADGSTLLAAVMYRAVREERLSLTEVVQVFGEDVVNLIEGVSQMDAITVSMDTGSGAILGQSQSQVDNLRRMLVTIIDDVRVVLLKLAERCSALRALKPYPARARQVSEEVSAVFAPLAHRLGIGHLKWELEDLSFRYMNPEAYKRIAKLLDGKRLERQHFIEQVTSTLQSEMATAGIEAEVNGRIKHIYSIWRKMQRKRILFSEVYDIRAVRILVNNVAECYAALGHAHSLWRNIPQEFDDYIANPKPNGYQSLHTAVVGPQGKVLEIQIRSHDMHADAEFGVCAHWSYKGAGATKKGVDSYEEKIEWLRQVLEWQEEVEDLSGLKGLSADVSEDRIYVFTPKGHVVDLPKSSTPIDFAYHIHTEVGHRCRGAKVNDRIVPLTYRLKTGQRISILTAKKPDPNRDWLRPDLGYCQSTRTRSKVQQWFRLQNREENLTSGRNLVERELKRLDLTSLDYKEVANKLHKLSVEDLYVAVGAGDITVTQVINAAERIVSAGVVTQQLALPAIEPRASSHSDPGIQVQGVGNLPTSVAACCSPVNGDQIAGYITLTRGVSVHRADCIKLLTLKAKESERIIAVNWGAEDVLYPAVLMVEAYDRQGLLRDITTVLLESGVNVTGMNTRSDKTKHMASMELRIEVSGIEALSSLITKLDQLANVLSAKRVRNA